MPEPIELSTTKIKVEHVDFKDKNSVPLNDKSPDREVEAFDERVCYDTNDSGQRIAESAIKYNAVNVMPNKIPYFFETPVPKYFRENGWFNNENTFKYVTWAFSRCSSQSHKVIMNGKELILEPFEFISGRLTSSSECFLTENQFRNQQISMQKAGFLKKTPNSLTNHYTCYIWITDRFSQNNNQPNNQPTTNRPPTDHHNQEDKKIRYKEKDHHPNPSSKNLMIDDSLKKEKIHVCLNVYLDQTELDECIKIKGSLENVKDCIEKIQNSPKRKTTIVHWAETLRIWRFKSVIADKFAENENLSKKFIDEYEENIGWQFRIFHDKLKDERGILFEGFGANSKPEMIAFTDIEFKQKLKKTIKDKKIKRKSEK